MISSLEEAYLSREVRVVMFPVPPSKAIDTVYAEDCWESATLERCKDIFDERLSCRVVASEFTSLGPAFVCDFKFCDIFSSSTLGDSKSIESRVNFCARVSYKKLFENKVTETSYATEAIIEGISYMSSSCHPGSHTVIPGSPTLTGCLLMSRINKDYEALGVRYMDDRSALKFFPHVSFKKNDWVEGFVKTWNLSDLTYVDSLLKFKSKLVTSRFKDVILPSLIERTKLESAASSSEEYLDRLYYGI